MSGELLGQLEREARARSNRLEALNKLPSDFTTQHYPLTTNEQHELRRLKHAAAAATDADTYVALAHGHGVHPSRINPQHLRYLARVTPGRVHEDRDG